MRILKKALLGLCSLLCIVASGVGIASVSNEIDAFAETAVVTADSWTISNLDGGEYWIHNENPITQGKDFTLEFTTERITKVTGTNGLWGATSSDNKEGWAYSSVIATNGYFALMQNGATSVSLDEFSHYRFYFKYTTSGANAGKYEFNAYRNGVHYYNNAFQDYKPYMGLYFYGLHFEAPLTSVKCYEGSGETAVDLGAYADESKSAGFYMETGASIRLSEPTGLGFSSRISLVDYNKAVETYGEENVSTGTLIALTSDISSLQAFTHADLTAQGVKYLDVANKGFKNEATATTDGYYTWRGAIVNMYAHNHTKDFSAVGYYCVNGEYTYTPYNAENNSRNVRFVALTAYNQTNPTQTDIFANKIEDGAHPAVGEYSPYTTEELQILGKYNVDMNTPDFWWSANSANPDLFSAKLETTGNRTWNTLFAPVGTTDMPNDAWTTLTLNASTVNMLMAQGYTSMHLQFSSKTNQGAMFVVYPLGDLSTQLAVGNLYCSCTVEFTETMAKNGVSLVVRTQDIHDDPAWSKSDDMDGFTVSITNLYAEYNEDIKSTWFTYDDNNDGISYNDETDTWLFKVENYKILKLNPQALAKYKNEGASALHFTISSKENQQTSFDFGPYGIANGAISFVVELTDEICKNGWSVQPYFATWANVNPTEESDGFLLKITPAGVLDSPAKWFTYDSTTEGITYENGKWIVTGASNKTLKLNEAVINEYLNNGISALKVEITCKDGQATTSSMQLPYSNEVVLGYSGSYTASGNSVMSNFGVSMTVKLTEEMAKKGLLITVYYNDRGWPGDSLGADGFIVSCETKNDSSLAENWVVGKDLKVAYDGTTYTLTSATEEFIPNDYAYIGISNWMINEMVANGKTTLQIRFGALAFPTYILFNVPSYTAVNIGSGQTQTITLNIADLSKNGDASSAYNEDGYFTIQCYVSNNNGIAYLEMTFLDVPEEGDYQIVYAKGADDAEYEAAKILAQRLQEATGVRYRIVSDRQVTWSEDSTYISVGQTSLLEEAGLGNLAESSVTSDGHIRRTVGNTLFIDGISARGTLYGVLDYLEDAYDFVFIDDGAYSFTPDTQLKINIEEKTFTPTFATRTYLTYKTCTYTTDSEYALYNKANCYYLHEDSMDNYGGINKIGAIGGIDHNMYDTLERGVALYNAIYGTSYKATDFAREYIVHNATNYNPCLSGGLSQNGLTALDFMTLAMKDCILNEYPNGTRYYSLTQEDDNENDPRYCICSSCVEQANLYGRSGLQVNFLNAMITALDSDADIRSANATDYRLITYAYQTTKQVPTGGVTCKDKLVIRLAYSPDSAQKGVSQNANNYIAQWSKVASELMYWGYPVDILAYLPYYPSLTAMADDVKFLKDNHISFVMMMGAYNAENIWHDQLRSFVYSRLMYNFDENAYATDKNAYVQSIVSEYLNIYYEEYADEVQSVIDYYQTAYGDKTPDSGKEYATCLTRTEHTRAYNLIKDSYQNCTDTTMKKRLASVAASCYAGILLASEWGRGQYIETTKKLCEAAGITQWKETVTVDTFLNS